MTFIDRIYNQKNLASTRFFPSWDHYDTNQVVGIINMIEKIFDINPNCHKWIEIGSHIGESATIFLGFHKIHELHCIDPNRDTTPIFMQRLHQFIESQRVKYYSGKSENFANLFKNKYYDVVYIDGCHDYDCVKQDIELYYPKIKQNGFLCGHDYTDSWPGTKLAIQEFFAQNNLDITKMLVFSDTSWMIQKN
jgi:hypothetical protein